MTPADLIKRYQEVKRTKLLMDAEYKESIKPYDEALDTIELALLDWLNENGLQNFKSPDGTAYKQVHINTKMIDRQAVIDHCVKNNNFDLFTNSLTKETVKEYLETHKAAPPGVEVTTHTVVNIRKS